MSFLIEFVRSWICVVVWLFRGFVVVGDLLWGLEILMCFLKSLWVKFLIWMLCELIDIGVWFCWICLNFWWRFCLLWFGLVSYLWKFKWMWLLLFLCLFWVLSVSVMWVFFELSVCLLLLMLLWFGVKFEKWMNCLEVWLKYWCVF